jgi:RHS repeat-associated protein
VFGQGIDEILMLQQGDVLDFDNDSNTTEITQSFYHINVLGSVMGITDVSQSVVESLRYSPYGEVTVTRNGTPQATDALGQPWGYTGRFADEETDLLYYRARGYDPERGRFLQRDPLGYQVGPGLYLYARATPTRWTDPLGLDCRLPLSPVVPPGLPDGPSVLPPLDNVPEWHPGCPGGVTAGGFMAFRGQLLKWIVDKYGPVLKGKACDPKTCNAEYAGSGSSVVTYTVIQVSNVRTSTLQDIGDIAGGLADAAQGNDPNSSSGEGLVGRAIELTATVTELTCRKTVYWTSWLVKCKGKYCPLPHLIKVPTGQSEPVCTPSKSAGGGAVQRDVDFVTRGYTSTRGGEQTTRFPAVGRDAEAAAREAFPEAREVRWAK